MINADTILKCLLIVGAILLQNCSKKNAHEGHQTTMSEDAITIKDLTDVSATTNKFVISDQNTVKPIYSNAQSTIQANGYITEDIRRNQKVSTRVSGRIEKLYIRYNYQYVKKGEKIMDIYSPDLNTYLEQYIFLKKTGDSSLLETARQKLLLLGVREAQLKRLQKQDSVGLTIEILSPSEGYIIFESAVAMISNTSDWKEEEMGRMNESDNSQRINQSEGRIREGAYVNAGETLFRVNDFKEVWAIISFKAQDHAFIKRDLQVSIHSELLLQDTIHGGINFIEPLYEQDQKFLQARVYLKNNRLGLKPNSILTCEAFLSGAMKLLLPQSSIFHLGKQDIVWVKSKMTSKNGFLFEARSIAKGAEEDGFVEIISGISSEDEVARDAGYLMDSQSNVILK
ncbi:MAG: efflux RND transporter periplasmic adaptor subunit [Bacteroidetes bacterium]|nr:efflux RND transporter periplasmic adaptor subunit [Bacteroidota bacterium]